MAIKRQGQGPFVPWPCRVRWSRRPPAPSSATQEPQCDRHDEYHECDRQDDAHLSLLPSFCRGLTPASSFW